VLVGIDDPDESSSISSAPLLESSSSRSLSISNYLEAVVATKPSATSSLHWLVPTDLLQPAEAVYRLPILQPRDRAVASQRFGPEY